MGASARVLMNRDQGWNSSTLGVHPAHQMARALGRDHDDIDIFRRNNGLEMNTKPVGDSQNLAGSQACPDLRLEKFALGLIRGEYLDPVGALGSFGWRHNFETI